MSISLTTTIAGVLLWILVIHFSLSNRHHPALRVALVLALGALFWGLNQNRPPNIPHHIMWVAPSVGLIANLWAMTVKLDKRAIASLLVGGLMVGLVIWATIPARATDSSIQLPTKEQLAESAGLTGAPPIDADFLRQIRGWD